MTPMNIDHQRLNAVSVIKKPPFVNKRALVSISSIGFAWSGGWGQVQPPLSARLNKGT